MALSPCGQRLATEDSDAKWSRAPDARTGLVVRTVLVMSALHPPSGECVLAGDDEMEVRHTLHGSLRIDALQPEHSALQGYVAHKKTPTPLGPA